MSQVSKHRRPATRTLETMAESRVWVARRWAWALAGIALPILPTKLCDEIKELRRELQALADAAA